MIMQIILGLYQVQFAISFYDCIDYVYLEF